MSAIASPKLPIVAALLVGMLTGAAGSQLVENSGGSKAKIYPRTAASLGHPPRPSGLPVKGASIPRRPRSLNPARRTYAYRGRIRVEAPPQPKPEPVAPPAKLPTLPLAAATLELRTTTQYANLLSTESTLGDSAAPTVNSPDAETTVARDLPTQHSSLAAHNNSSAPHTNPSTPPSETHSPLVSDSQPENGPLPELAPTEPNVDTVVGVDYAQLSAQIESYNWRMGETEDLLRTKLDWDVAGLIRIFHDLQHTQGRRDVWQLYWNILTNSRRRKLPQPVPVHGVLELMRQRVFEVKLDLDADSDSMAREDYVDQTSQLGRIDEQVLRWQGADDARK